MILLSQPSFDSDTSKKGTDMDDAVKEKITIQLPEPKMDGTISLEKAIAGRRSRRKYGERKLDISELGQMLWSGLGITGRSGKFKASPSAGARHPLNLFVAVAPDKFENLDGGFYAYNEEKHDLVKLSDKNFIPEIAENAYKQKCIFNASAVLVITIEYGRSMSRYGERGVRYSHMDAGHLGQNLYLQAETINLSTVGVGAFSDDILNHLLPVPAAHEVKYMFPFGPRE
ncbi:MAG: SagB/ThcOx family dehydrogenase [Planctomycetota bacterium]|jgi:SagB-type dehydrogenase family enzyme